MPRQKSLNIFIAPLNWGLGHATRDLPLIKKIIENGHRVYIGANDRSRILLQNEIPQCEFIDFPDYPIKYSRSKRFLLRFMLVTYPNMILAMMREKNALKKLHDKYKFDIIISDNRFNLKLDGVKSYLISHQLRYKLPFPLSLAESLPELFNSYFFNKYDKIIIPDVDGSETLTAQISHQMKFIAGDKLYYAGIMTDIENNNEVTQDIDYFIVVSGPEPQRTRFEQIVFEQVNNLEGKIVVALGKPEKDYKITQGNAVFYTHLNRQKMNEYMQRAKFIISRPGYTTIMEMVALGKKGLLIPTPGQVEQVYLAEHYQNMGWSHYASQYKLNIPAEVKTAAEYHGFPASFMTSQKNIDHLFTSLF